MNTLGRHLLVEYRECDPGVLDDVERIEVLLKAAAVAARATVVTSALHPFHPQGVSGVVVVEESHLSIHTWPEQGYASVDFYTCGECEPERAHEVLREGLKSRRWELMRVDRGFEPPGRGLRLAHHYSESSSDDYADEPRDMEISAGTDA